MIVFPKLLILGHGRHGKDTVAEYWGKTFGLTFESSSRAACNIFIYNLLRDKYNYTSADECYDDRYSHRAEWYDLIVEFNKLDRSRLAKEILRTKSCYVGMRDSEEFQACKDNGLFDLIIWVDASNRLPEEPSDSFNISRMGADIIIDNNGSLDSLYNRIHRLGCFIFI